MIPLIANAETKETRSAQKHEVRIGYGDPMVTYDVAKNTDVIGFPAVVPMFLQGTIYANDLMLK